MLQVHFECLLIPKLVRSCPHRHEHGSHDPTTGLPRLPTTMNLIGFTESTKDFTRQKPGQPFLNGLGSLGDLLPPAVGVRHLFRLNGRQAQLPRARFLGDHCLQHSTRGEMVGRKGPENPERGPDRRKNLGCVSNRGTNLWL